MPTIVNSNESPSAHESAQGWGEQRQRGEITERERERERGEGEREGGETAREREREKQGINGNGEAAQQPELCAPRSLPSYKPLAAITCRTPDSVGATRVPTTESTNVLSHETTPGHDKHWVFSFIAP